jgi:hypothetical protein
MWGDKQISSNRLFFSIILNMYIIYILYMYKQVSITLPPDLVRFIHDQKLNLSKFVQEKLRNEIKERHYQEK